MKNGRVLSKVSILAVMLIMSGSAFAQRGQRVSMRQDNRGRMAINDNRPVRSMQRDGSRLDAVLDLSEEQKEAMQALRAEHQKEMTYQKNLLNEKNAKLRTLMSAPERDQKAVDAIIDDISGMKGDLLKKQIANRDEMKKILNAEQVEKLESLGFGNGGRQGFRSGNGKGMRDGRAGNFRPDSRRNFHGKGLNRPVY